MSSENLKDTADWQMNVCQSNICFLENFIFNTCAHISNMQVSARFATHQAKNQKAKNNSNSFSYLRKTWPQFES